MRFDRTGALRSFLVDQSRTSIVLSHQLVWACQAEMGNTDTHGKESSMLATINLLICPPIHIHIHIIISYICHVNGQLGIEGDKKDPFKEIVSGLSDDITSALGHDEKRFMKEEFDFFEKITAMSGLLKVGLTIHCLSLLFSSSQ
jgi:hypothetical protein